jgi:1,2-diacylglycerol 3-alpha-glucosyltransferase
METFGLVIREAAVCRVPSLVLVDTPVARAITDGFNGFVCPRSADGYAERLTWLLQHPRRRREAGRHALRTLHTPWSKVVERVERKYWELLRG